MKEKIQIDSNSWLTARCSGPGYHDYVSYPDVWNRGIFAHTSPIYVACGGDWEMYDADAAQYMLTLIEGGMSYIQENASRHAHGSVTHHHGEDDHLAYLLRPYLEAQEAIQRRMQ